MWCNSRDRSGILFVRLSMVIKPEVDTRQQVLVQERAFRAVHVESENSIRLTHVEFRAVGHVTGESGCALCQSVAQMTRL